MNATLQKQQSWKVASENPLPSPAVASEQQENSQVISITEEESVSNLDLDDGGMSKLFYKLIAASVLYSDVLNEAISDILCIAYFQNVSIGGQHLVCCSCSRPTK